MPLSDLTEDEHAELGAQPHERFRQDCIDRLRDLAQTLTSDYRIAAAQIVRDFNAQSSDADREN